MLKVMTSDADVIAAAGDFMPWLLLMPAIGCAAFTWDGIYIGATASVALRNSMLWSVVAFAAVWVAGMVCLGLGMSSSDGSYGFYAMHVLMAAYFAHLLARTIYLSVKYRNTFLTLRAGNN